jgi:hypothetical protein
MSRSVIRTRLVADGKSRPAAHGGGSGRSLVHCRLSHLRIGRAKVVPGGKLMRLQWRHTARFPATAIEIFYGNCNRSNRWLRNRIRCSRVAFPPKASIGETSAAAFITLYPGAVPGLSLSLVSVRGRPLPPNRAPVCGVDQLVMTRSACCVVAKNFSQELSRWRRCRWPNTTTWSRQSRRAPDTLH